MHKMPYRSSLIMITLDLLLSYRDKLLVFRWVQLPIWFEVETSVLIASVPGHCLPFAFCCCFVMKDNSWSSLSDDNLVDII